MLICPSSRGCVAIMLVEENAPVFSSDLDLIEAPESFFVVEDGYVKFADVSGDSGLGAVRDLCEVFDREQFVGVISRPL